VFVNDPGLGSDDQSYFNGDIMTYYGRWTYKFEEGARQGLKGVLIIHEDRGAGYEWSVVQASAKSKMFLDGENGYQCPLNGWLRNDVARKLLADNGYNLDDLKEQAKKPDFKPFALKSKISIELNNTFTHKSSPNVVGYIQGSGNTDESVVYLGHWDHMGVTTSVNGDSIINGASDNAVAIAWMLEIARCFNALDEKPRRNVVFVSPTCEETGMFGSSYYVEHPLFPIEKATAVINLDVFPLWGENNDVTITGYGNSDLDSLLSVCAVKYNRYIMPDPDAYNGMFYRSDHLSFMKKGVPAMFAKGWNDNRKNGKDWSKKMIADYWANTYHKVSDEVHPETDDYSGLLQEVHLFFDFGYILANQTTWPKWSANSEFAGILER
ncbi:MAG: M20/M25/M40 family metallo-hydrolase, partial [Bacteroidales bacterium]|nr:M20/M25/M40 family metallo-hydrolase [Bacteroidales bacterium]